MAVLAGAYVTWSELLAFYANGLQTIEIAIAIAMLLVTIRKKE